MVPATAPDYEQAYQNAGLPKLQEITGVIEVTTTSSTNFTYTPTTTNTRATIPFELPKRPDLEVVFMHGKLVVTVHGDMDDLDIVNTEISKLIDNLMETQEVDELEYYSDSESIEEAEIWHGM